MALTLYSVPESLYSAKLRIVLRHKAVDFKQEMPPGGYGSDAYKTIVPAGTIPAIVHEGFVLADSEAIAGYLEEVWPDPPLLPVDAKDRARARELSRFHDTRLEPEIRTLFGQVAPNGRAAHLVISKAEQISIRLAQLSGLISEYPLHARGICLGDCGFPISFEWLDAFFPAIGPELHWPEQLIAYRDDLHKSPAIARELADYRPAVLDWTNAKLAEQSPS